MKQNLSKSELIALISDDLANWNNSELAYHYNVIFSKKGEGVTAMQDNFELIRKSKGNSNA